jgi:glycosyltransferase involved in cell wall biosynthesis
VVKILHLNHAGSHAGGVEGYIADVSAALGRAGHSTVLVHFSPRDGAGLVANTHYAPLAAWPEPPVEAMRGIERVIATFRPDVAYVHAVYHPGLVQWVAHRLPTVAYVHGPYPVCPGSGQYLRRGSRVCPRRAGLLCLVEAQTERCCWGRNPVKHVRLLRRVRSFVEAYARVEAILVGSEYMQGLVERGGVPSEKLGVLPPVLFQEPAPPLTFSAASGTILFAGRLTPEKGLRSLIQAVATMKGDWRLVVAGEGEEAEPCQALAQQLGVADRVHFAGRLQPAEMEAELQGCACVAIPSLWPEPYGRLGPEAFVHGRPAVAFAVGGIPDWLEHGETGYLVPPGDTAQLAASLRILLGAPELRRRMGQQARQTALAGWDAATHVERLLSAFEQARAHSAWC